MRSTLDKLVSWTGLALAVVLLVAGGLLTWANQFIGDQVQDQLSMQDITMPEGPALEGLSDEDVDALEEFAGEPMTTGPAARAYADHYILAHMNASSDGMSYSEVSNEQRALAGEIEAAGEPTAEQVAELEELSALKQSLLDGNTLRGLLLYGYAFATIGTIAGIAAIAAFGGAAVMLVLAALGFRHAARVRATA